MLSEPFRLSPQQRRLWLAQSGGEPAVSRIGIAIEGPLDEVRLHRAVQSLVDRHEILRTVFCPVPGLKIPAQQVSSEGTVFWEEGRLEDFAAENHDRTRIEELLRQREAASGGYDLSRGPVLRASLFRQGADRHLLVLSLPALCADEVSLLRLCSDLAEIYGRGEGDPEPEEPIQYLQFSEWQYELLEGQTEESGQGRHFWRRQLSEGPSDIPGVPGEAVRGEGGVVRFSLASDLLARLDAVASRRGVSADLVLLAALQVLIARLSGERAGGVALSFDGRKFPELRQTVGLMARFIPTRSAHAIGESFSTILDGLAESVRAAEAWQELYEPEASPAGDALSRTGLAFLYQELPPPLSTGGVSLQPLWWVSRFQAFPLEIRAVRGAEELAVELTYAGEAAQGMAEGLALRYRLLLEHALRNPETGFAEAELLTPQESRELLDVLNRTERELPDICAHELFERTAAAHPESVAVEFKTESRSYRELEERANDLAWRLRERGVGPESVVGLFLERSPELLVAILGVWKAGSAYVALDPGEPVERLRFVLEETKSPVVVTVERLAGALPAPAVQVMLVDQGGTRRDRPAAEVGPQSLAYVLYTSGSTGRPKGVMVPHRGLVNYLVWAAEAYRLQEGGGALVHSPVGFDLTVTSLLAPLVVGQRVVLVPEEQGLEGLSTALLADREYSLVKLTPSHLEVLNELSAGNSLEGRVRVLVLGGEALRGESLAAWREDSPGTQVVNEYGPTETVVGCLVHSTPAGEVEPGPVPIGRPIANTRVYVLDGWLRPLPAGAVGELYVGGSGVTRGYMGRPGETAQRFVPDALGTKPGERLYRTGDRVRFRENGELEYLGRLDAQVKVRGHRVEPAEIEHALMRHPGVAEAVVLARNEDGQGNRLVAYFTSRAGLSPVSGDLRAFLQQELPEYMIPSAFVSLAAFPLTANGKVDRAALLARGIGRPQAETAYVAPETELERTLAAIWKDVLRVERVGLYDNFFDLGGHSLLMVQVFSRIKAQIETELLMVELFEFPTISSMAKRLVQEREQTAPAELTAGRAEARLENLEGFDEDDAAAARMDSRRSFENV